MITSTRTMTDAELRRHLDDGKRAVDVALGDVLTRWDERVGDSVARAIRHGVLGGGKRLRPILCATAYRACGGRGQDAALWEFAVALELIHAYSLMHDDLPCMDDAELRRGRPTTHRVHGEEATVRAGAALIPIAIHTALEGARALGCAEDVARAAARALAEAAGAGGMVGGQALDLLGEGRELTFDELREIHTLKTGALLTASLTTGAIAARAPERVRAGLREYGRAIGLAFQIADDVLDATATAEELGKKPSDADLSKSTYVTIHGLDEARAMAAGEADSAGRALERSGIDAPALHALARYVVTRRH